MNYLIIIFVILIDQLSKFIIQSRFFLGKSISIIPNVFHITYVRNVGAAFGILKNQQKFFIFITSITIIGVIIFVLNRPQLPKIVLYSLSLIMGGAIGNLTDRIRFGYVIDFFDFRIWPVFNIADISIITGTAFLAYYIIFSDKKDTLDGKNG